MQMKRVSVLCLVLIMSCVIVGCNSHPNEPGRYYDESKGFSIKYPVGWEKIKTPPTGIEIQFANPTNTEKTAVQVQKISPQQTLADGFSFMKSYIQNNGGEISSEGQEVIDNRDAKWLISSISSEKVIYYLIKKDNYLYAIMFSCDKNTFSDDFENTMREVAKTFRFEQ